MWPVKRSTFGDEDRIYRTNPVPALVRLVIIVAVSVVALLTVDPRLAILIALVMAVLAGVPLALEFRRAVMISAAEFEYKWATAPRRRSASQISRALKSLARPECRVCDRMPLPGCG